MPPTAAKEYIVGDADRALLEGKVAIVTGGAGGIGRAYCHALAAAGASVIVADLDEEGAQKVAGEITSDRLAATAARVDIADVESVAAMVDAARTAYSGVDVLVNNAAIMDMQVAPLATYPLDLWERAFRINVTGALICTQAVVPLMRERGGGKIINQSSSGAFTGAGAYGIGKLALIGLTVALARELGPDRIHVNAIAPGMVETDAAFQILPPDDPLRERMKKSAVMQAFGQPDDLCGPLLFLASSASDWMTGQTLNVDGGAIFRI
jgi:NAD(P)-dependent dehydrogenase (short-subunit alcohol dehydrogenase family)